MNYRIALSCHRNRFFFSNAMNLQSLKEKVPGVRNSPSILDVLMKVLEAGPNSSSKLLEISSGSGQHILYFADAFPTISFQPSEYDCDFLPSIAAYAESAKHKNVKEPIFIDISMDLEEWLPTFKEGDFDYILNINMTHITPWECTEGLFRSASQIMGLGGLLILYGPFSENGVIAPSSNLRFHQMLTTQDPEWGIRDIKDLQELGSLFKLELRQRYEMPVHNRILVWEKMAKL